MTRRRVNVATATATAKNSGPVQACTFATVLSSSNTRAPPSSPCTTTSSTAAAASARTAGVAPDRQTTATITSVITPTSAPSSRWPCSRNKSQGP